MIFTRDPETNLEDFEGTELPKKLLISLKGDCPNRCDHCMRAVPDGFWPVPPGGPLPEWILAEIEKLLPGIRSIRVGGVDYGEQLLSPLIERFLTTLTAYPKIHVQMMSGMPVMDETKADLIARTVDVFEWSIEGIGERYEAVRHIPWKRVHRHLQMLVEARKRHSPKLKIDAVVTCFRDNLSHLEEILDLANEGIDQFHFRRFVPNSKRQEFQKLEYHRGEANRVFQRLVELGMERGIPVVCAAPFPMVTLAGTTTRHSTRDAKHGENLPEKPRKKWICHFPFEAIKIDTDATVGSCCVRMELGRLKEEDPDLMSIWKGKEFRALRKAISEGDWPAACLMCEFRASQLDWLKVG